VNIKQITNIFKMLTWLFVLLFFLAPHRYKFFNINNASRIVFDAVFVYCCWPKYTVMFQQFSMNLFTTTRKINFLKIFVMNFPPLPSLFLTFFIKMENISEKFFLREFVIWCRVGRTLWVQIPVDFKVQTQKKWGIKILLDLLWVRLF